MIESVTEVDREEVGRGASVEATGDIVESLTDALERLAVPDIGDEHIVFMRQLCTERGDHGVAEGGETDTGLCRNLYKMLIF